MRTNEAIYGMNQRPISVDPFAALTLEWQATGTRIDARRVITTWSERVPAFAVFPSPVELIDAINQPGDPVRSCTLLANLLVIAGADRWAVRAVLQAVTPGVREAATARWRKATVAGPWRTVDEIGADALSAAWDAIHAHAGRFHARPARVIVRHVEQALRRTHTRWARDSEVIRSLESARNDTSEVAVGVQTPEDQAAALIDEAFGCDVIDPLAIALLTMTGVLGYPTAEVARTLALPYGDVHRRLRRARRAMRIWLDYPAEGNVQPPANRQTSGRSRRRCEVRGSPRQLQLRLDNDRQDGPIEARPLPIAIRAGA
jgi:DNA-directed RNA polymerase specialized sigma24 family protein